MSSDHKRPLYAFAGVSLLCAMVVLSGLRSDALVGFLRQIPVATGLVQTDRAADTPSGDEQGSTVKESASATPAATPRAATADWAKAIRTGLPAEDGSPGSLRAMVPDVFVTVPAPVPSMPGETSANLSPPAVASPTPAPQRVSPTAIAIPTPAPVLPTLDQPGDYSASTKNDRQGREGNGKRRHEGDQRSRGDRGAGREWSRDKHHDDRDRSGRSNRFAVAPEPAPTTIAAHPGPQRVKGSEHPARSTRGAGKTQSTPSSVPVATTSPERPKTDRSRGRNSSDPRGGSSGSGTSEWTLPAQDQSTQRQQTRERSGSDGPRGHERRR